MHSSSFHNFELDDILNFESPPWHPVSSRELSRLLGVSLQTLANWRVRETGPEPAGPIKGRGNKIYYRPDIVMEWASHKAGHPVPWYFYSGNWLNKRGLSCEISDANSVATAMRVADDVLVAW